MAFRFADLSFCLSTMTALKHHVVSFWLLAYLAGNSTAAFTDSSGDIERKHFTESPNGRGTLDILRSCLFTVFICCWTVVHPDIPRPGSPWRRTFLDRVICLLLAALAPEVVVYAAYYQHIQAQASFNKISKPSRSGWTMCHSFYAEMGGFGLQQSDLIREG